MLTQEMIDRATSIVGVWLPRYPTAHPRVDDTARAALRESEDSWLATFDNLDSLAQAQINELTDWKWQGYRARCVQARRGVEGNWDHVSRCIARALAVADAETAIDALIGPMGGIPNWQTAMQALCWQLVVRERTHLLIAGHYEH